MCVCVCVQHLVFVGRVSINCDYFKRHRALACPLFVRNIDTDDGERVHVRALRVAHPFALTPAIMLPMLW